MAKKAEKAKKAKKAKDKKKRGNDKKKQTKSKSAKKAKAPSIDAVARKIVSATQQPDYPFATLYSESCVSAEPAGEPVRGHAGLAQKQTMWESMQSGTTWKPRNVWTGKDTVCIEWDAEVQMRDGRVVHMTEIAIHEIGGGLIQAERYYYNPAVLAPPAS